MLETRKHRLLRLQRERQLTQAARKLRDRQQGVLAALGTKALIPHGGQRSALLFKR